MAENIIENDEKYRVVDETTRWEIGRLEQENANLRKNFQKGRSKIQYLENKVNYD